ncbi:hypothetical protein [Chondromyces apiculatus]|uniref:Uncharacterized protein n=1 Tax=Chondromyces apiculatus DSM 436 TaxID=1192034 RepID=A0A017SWC0_9BACT|nr:hypothetical protein [Chondromyces apiculatus]EYF00915.1 Hypothetical protein CAP_8863 [Chondromyces apiculatus DSM 436]
MSDVKVSDEQLETRADLLRERLTRTLDELDRRRQEVKQVVSVKAQVKRHPEALLAGFATVMVAVGGGITLAVLGIRSREERLRRERVAALQRMWWHPQNVARKKRGVLASIGRGIVVSAGTTAGLWVLRRAALAALEKVNHPQLGPAAPVNAPLALPAGEQATIEGAAEPVRVDRDER